MSNRIASCSCGQLTATVIEDPVRVGICHCLACQQRTGSVFAVQARFRSESVTLSGRSSQYVRVGDEGTRTTFHFCPSCGATVHFSSDARRGFTLIPVGAFAAPDFPSPTISVYEERRHPWVSVPADIEHIG